MLTSLDLYFMIKELSFLESSKLSQVYNPKKKQLLLQFHTKVGKVILNIEEDKIFLTEDKEQQETATNLAMFLRKKLSNAVVKKIEQKDFERILIITLQKEKKFQLIIELFSKGNVILIDENNKILACVENQSWRDRNIRPGIAYEFPPTQNNFLKLTKKQLKEIIETSKKSSIVKILATDLNLGGNYAEELCFLSKIDKNSKDINIDKLLKEIENIKESKLKPNKAIDETFPIDLKTKTNKKYFKTFSEAIESIKTTDSAYEKRLNQLNKRLEDQKQQLRDLEEKSITHKKIGDLIYQDYNRIQELVNKVKETKWKFDSKEILEKNPKEKKIIIELK
ncbi:MAG: NFACT family protein [Nanoarchaeota archaeon]|nr:NFACT family protein [Nanoarchaeota archaeon]MBU1445067.1 NFACT family protein [Nanoarchaeota archaeon]MBU2406494.1 NFACT family protein [Nanoarchaeota archaeon]MBU2420594.1 NFACT family protein [Nanoarchaeota archaeon]MBU2475194.1 NFACT family protein [Nanoarchaeota archaeon]